MPSKGTIKRARTSRENIVETWLSDRPSIENVIPSRSSEPAIYLRRNVVNLKESVSDTGLNQRARELEFTWSGYGFGDRHFYFGRSALDHGSERDGLSRPGHTPFKPYLARWYVLVVFSVFALTQYCLWNTFGPISNTLEKGFYWSSSEVAMLANWDTILYIFFAMQICWIVERKGIRNSVIGSVICSVIGSGLRCITSDPKSAFWTMNAGQIMNGLAGTVAQAVGPVISMVWFPPGERATATAVSSLFASFGVAVSFIVGPLLVENPTTNLRGVYVIENGSTYQNGTFQAVKDSLEYTPEEYRSRVMTLLYLEFAFSFILLLLVVAYFPNKPPTPPSNSASLRRLGFRDGFRVVLRKKSFWLLVFIGASTTGIYSGWYALLVVNLNGCGLHLKQTEAGWIGCYSTLTGIIGGLIMGKLVDQCTRRMKLSITILYFFAMLSFLWVSLMCLKITDYTLGNLYQACMVGGFCIAGSLPLLYEFVIEMTYPVPETVSIGILTLANNGFTFLFLLALSISSASTRWMNWCLVAACAIAVPLLCFMQDEYNRLDTDLQNIVVERRKSDLVSPSVTYPNSLAESLPTKKNAYSESSGSLYVNQSNYSTCTSKSLSCVDVVVAIDTCNDSEAVCTTEDIEKERAAEV